MDFKDWITNKLIDHEKKLNSRVTVSEYAAYLGVAQSVLSQWLNGTRTPSHQKSIEKLAGIFGEEVYAVLGKQTVQRYDPISSAPPEIKSRFSAAIAEANQRFRDLADSGNEPSESEASQIIVDSLAKHGFSSKVT